MIIIRHQSVHAKSHQRQLGSRYTRPGQFTLLARSGSGWAAGYATIHSYLLHAIDMIRRSYLQIGTYYYPGT